jgi:hypothetical protein
MINGQSSHKRHLSTGSTSEYLAKAFSAKNKNDGKHLENVPAEVAAAVV